MTTSDLDILVVDDARFSAAVVNRTLASAGYNRIRHASNAADALQRHQEHPADLLVADWLMPSMDGLELTRRIRQQDEANNRYTYVLLLTAREGGEALQQAFDQGVDDFVSKSALTEQLAHRVMAADRIIQRHNRVSTDYQQMLDINRQLKQYSLLDPLTGFGNHRDAQRSLNDTLRQAEKREGAACVVMLRLDNYHEIHAERGEKVLQQGILAFSRRLRQSVRPLDRLCRLTPDRFVLITHQQDIQHCTPASFQRLYEALNNRAYQTAAGFISLQVSMSMSYSHGGDTPATLLGQAHDCLDRSREEKRLVASAESVRSTG